jgi:DNA primase
MTMVTMTSIERIRAALDAGGYQPETARQGRFKALCPVHGDTHRSLSVTHDPNRGMTLLHCFSCQAGAADVLNALGLSLQDAFDAPLERDTRPSARAPRPRQQPAPQRIAVRPAIELPRTGWTTTATYDYTSSDGTVIEQVQRRELTVDGIRHKKFVQQFRQPDGSYAWSKPDAFSPVFYRQADVDQALAAGAPVWILEGEKDADNAAAAGISSATTNAQGAGQFPTELIRQLHGPVVIVADRDLAGYTRARDLKATLTRNGVDVTILLPATLEAKSDLTDHLEAGYGISDLIKPTDRDLEVLILAAATCKVISHQLRRDLDEIDAHTTAARTDGDPDREHLQAARYWATRVQTAWEQHRTEQLAGFVPGSDLTDEGHRAAHQIGRAIACATTTLGNLRAGQLITGAERRVRP